MKKSPEELELNFEQTTQLLKLGLQTERGESKATKRNRSDLLLDTLASKLPVKSALLESLPDVLKSLSEELESISGLPLSRLLLDSQTKIPCLKNIKDYAKQSGAAACDDIERDVTLAIYYASIANALIYHDQKITNLSYQNLQKSYSHLSQKNWIPGNLVSLFIKASEYCQDKAK